LKRKSTKGKFSPACRGENIVELVEFARSDEFD